jgi:Tol biopolymer transport system component
VVLTSIASNLVPDDTNGEQDVFVRDRETGRTTRVSVGAGGAQGNRYSGVGGISADGRYVAFRSYASSLVADDTNGEQDVFVHDRQTGRTTRVSLDPRGAQFAASSGPTAISPYGRYVGFYVSPERGFWQSFLYDRETGRTTRLSVGIGGKRANGDVSIAGISLHGRFVVLTSIASNLVPDDTNGEQDVFVRDRQTGRTTRVSVGAGGAQGNAGSIGAGISADGRYVTFDSNATNLVPGDTNDLGDVFVHDRQTSRTTRVSVTARGAQAAGGNSANPAISADGQHVAFNSHAANLARRDTNAAFDIFVATRR